MNAEQFSKHVIFERLEQLSEVLNKEKAKELIAIDDYDFIKTFHDYATAQFRLVSFTLVSEKELNAISVEINAGVRQLNTFFGNKNRGHLSNAMANFNSALVKIRNLPLLLAQTDFDFSKSVSNFQKNVKKGYESLEKENKKLHEALKDTQRSIDSKNTQIKELEEKLKNKGEEIDTFLSSYKSDLEKIKRDNQSSFEADKKKYREDIESDRKAYEKSFTTDKESFQEGYKKLKNDIESQTNETIKDLISKLEEAKRIVNIVGNIGVTGNYQKIANEHKKSANLFRWISIGTMVVMSGLLIWTIIDLSKDGFDIYKSIVRIVAATLLTYPAIYASKESSKHRILETKNRNLELELASLGPFIELLSDNKKEEIKEKLVHRYFGNNSTDENEKEGDEEVSVNNLEKILKALLPLIKK